jgi:3-oxoacyl-[acyl-carrier-protein] synthase III
MTNADFEKIVDTSDEWITTRTGIKERRIASAEEATSDMAVAACRNALEMASVANEDIDMLVLGTVTPDYRLPSCACVVQEKMGLPNAMAFDIVSACTGFINGLSVAQSFIESGKHKKILVVGVEKLSSITNYKDRGTCILFGDAAGAAVVSAETNGKGILSSYLKSDGNMRQLLWITLGGSVNPYKPNYADDGTDKIYMNGGDVFKTAVREMGKAAIRVLEDAGVSAEQVNVVIPHQANVRIIESLAKRLDISMDKVYVNIERYGNTSAASIPLALDEANRAGKIKDGDYVLMMAFGGGLTWGASLMKW